MRDKIDVVRRSPWISYVPNKHESIVPIFASPTEKVYIVNFSFNESVWLKNWKLQPVKKLV